MPRRATRPGLPIALRVHATLHARRGVWDQSAVARIAKGIAVLVVVGAMVLYVAFPTDDLVRRALATVLRPGGPTLVFRRAVLRPWGLRLDQVTLAAADGSALAALDWVRVRPSLGALLRLDYLGRPWIVSAHLCEGTLDGTVDPAAAIAVTARWQGLALAGCPPLTRTDLVLAGRTDGTAMIRFGGGADAAGDGRLVLHDFSIRDGTRQRLPGDLGSLAADAASLRWTLAGRLLTASAVDWHGPEVELAGDGRVRLAGSVERSELDLQLKIAPGPTPPTLVGDLLASLPAVPDEPGARRLVVRGTVGNPVVQR